MKKRYMFSFALALLIGGLSLMGSVLVGGQIFADASGVVSANETLISFLTFGGAMVGTSIVFFIILASI